MALNRARNILLQATIIVLSTSCSVRVPYTSAIQQKYELSEQDLKNVQFFISHEVVLYKASDDGDAVAMNGELLVRSDKQIEEVVIRKGTPGVVVNADTRKLAVSFEIGEDRYLVFGSNTSDGWYHLMAEEWTRRHGKLQYAGNTYFAAPGSGMAHLQFKMRKLRLLEKQSKIAKGRKL